MSCVETFDVLFFFLIFFLSPASSVSEQNAPTLFCFEATMFDVGGGDDDSINLLRIPHMCRTCLRKVMFLRCLRYQRDLVIIARTSMSALQTGSANR